MTCETRGGMVVCGRGSRCKGCGRKIKWVKTAAGKNMPVDIEAINIMPSKTGHVVVITLSGNVVRGNLVMSGTPNAVMGYTSHFSTCPDAEKFRKRETG